MNWNWIDLEELRSDYKKAFGAGGSTLICILRPIVHALQEAYPDGRAWLLTPAKSKVEFRNYHRNELSYILAWCFARKLLEGNSPDVQENRRAMIDYLATRWRSSTIKRWALHWGLLSKNELAIAETIKPRHRYDNDFEISLAMHSFMLMKPLSAFSEHDVEFANRLPTGRCYSTKSLQDLRVRLGYSEIPPERQFRTCWDDVLQHPALGSQARKFRSYLTDGDARKQMINLMGQRLRELGTFMDQKHISDCSRFGEQLWGDFLVFLENGPKGRRRARTVIGAACDIRHFFRWGIGDPFFPRSLELPTQEWGRLQTKAMEETWQGDGHAFASEGIAKRLVSAIMEDDPKTDREQLCNWFWKIAASSPPRFTFIRNLDAARPLARMPNDPNALGLSSPDADKAGIQYGQYPVLDSMGIEAIKALQERVKHLGLLPIWNRTYRRSYVHLFQLPDPPWILPDNALRDYLDKIKQRLSSQEPNNKIIKGGAHALRTHILTHIGRKTGSLPAVQLAAGHRNEEMTRLYLRSRVARSALLYRVVEQYERGELTGRFYYQLIRLLTSNETSAEAMLTALTEDITLDKFLARFGKRLEMGHCLNQEACENWFRCWGCQHFLMKKDEIGEAVSTLAAQVINMRQMIYHSRGFTYDNSIAAGQMRAIGHLVKRILDFGMAEDQLASAIRLEMDRIGIKSQSSCLSS